MFKFADHEVENSCNARYRIPEWALSWLCSRTGRFADVRAAGGILLSSVESCSLTLDDGSTLEPGFFEESAGRFAIRVSSEASDSVVQETIEHASAEAARLISRKFLN
jgi:hypothetical protein